MRVKVFRWNRANLPLWVFVGFFLLYLISSSGGFESGDALVRYETAKSILAGKGGALPPNEEWNSTVRVSSGKVFSTYGPMQSLLMLPSMMVVDKLPISERAKDGANRLWFNLVILPLVSALTLVLLYEALGLMGFTPFLATLTVLTVGMATPFWHYARSAQEENMVALGFSAWLLGMILFNIGRRGGLLLACSGACFALATRYAAVACLLPMAIATSYFIGRRWRLLDKKELTASVMICAVVVLSLLAYNHYRFGSYGETGYGLFYRHAAVPFFSFVQAPARALILLFSPYRGLFFYVPAFVFVVIAVFMNWRRLSLLEWTGIAAMLGALVMNSGFYYWNAGHSWGPRLLVAPLLLLSPLFARFYQKFALTSWWKPVVTLSVVVQLASIALPSSTEDIIRERAEVAPLVLANAWKCDYSAVCLRPKLVVRALINTVMNHPGMTIDQGTKSMKNALESSDYRTLFWWPFRFSFRFGYFNRYIAIFITGIFAAVSLSILFTALRISRSSFSLRSA